MRKSFEFMSETMIIALEVTGTFCQVRGQPQGIAPTRNTQSAIRNRSRSLYEINDNFNEKWTYQVR
ncbi:MAG: hypothetical protein ACPGWR_19040 [Ardenticatenaceae bacterium]